MNLTIFMARILGEKVERLLPNVLMGPTSERKFAQRDIKLNPAPAPKISLKSMQ